MEIDLSGKKTTKSQVKIRGFRVEPSGVAACLNEHSFVEQAVVLSKKDEKKGGYLVAFIIPNKSNALTGWELRQYLMLKLPAYMIPSYFFFLQELPLSLNGKIDYQALKKMDEHQAIRLTPYVAATQLNERRLQSIWSEILDRDVAEIGIDDNFFFIGGHSLLVTSLLLLLQKKYCLTFNVADFYQSPTIRQLAPLLREYQYSSHDKKQAAKSMPLSNAQKLIWLHQQLAPDQPIYNEPMSILMPHVVDTKQLELAVNQFIKRHDILRVQFYVKAGRASQKIMPYHFVPLEIIKNSQEEALKYATNLAQQTFNLEKDFLIRFFLAQYDDQTYELFFVTHHLLVDGVSTFQIMMSELEALYLGKSLPSLQYQCLDLIALEEDEKSEVSKKFWQEYLDDLPVLQLPVQKEGGRRINFKGTRQCFNFDDIAIFSLSSLAQKENVTLFALLFAVFSILLYRYSNQADLAIGTVVSNRAFSEMQTMVGNFLNTVILRVNINKQSTFSEYIKAIWKNLKKVYAHQGYPFSAILEEQKNSRMPVQVAFVYEPRAQDSQLGWECSQLKFHSGATKFDLTFELDERDGALIGRVEYATELFEDWFIADMINHFKVLLQSVLANQNQPISLLPLFNHPDENIFTCSINKNIEMGAYSTTLHAIFEKQVLANPNLIALIFYDMQLTYHELNERANQFARYLLDQKIPRKSFVIVALDRSLDLIIALLGILKAGCIYVPISKKSQAAYFSSIVKDLKPAIILEQLPDCSRYLTSNLCIDILYNDLAYVIYTSGTTGKPKGVMIEHRSIINTILAQKEIFNINVACRVGNIFLPQFDGFLSEVFVTLFSGGIFCLSGNSVIESLQRNQINALSIFPSLLSVLPFMDTLTTIVIAGEAADLSLLAKWEDKVKLLNAYGPTESAICATMHKYSKKDKRVYIGNPIVNTKIYVLDENLQQVPIGVIGEICISGLGLARGYLNQPELTAEKFIKNPFEDKDPYNRLYRTGDLGRYWPDGNIEFIGRADEQVKIHGFRIECGEVELALLAHPSIHQAVVVAREDKNLGKYLAAYFVPCQPIDIDTLRQFLKTRLPEYMVPTSLMTVKQFPLTSSGKIDKKNLPDSVAVHKKRIILPQTELEKKILSLWKKHLKQKKISIEDNFFDLGGDSIIAMRLIYGLEKGLNLKISLGDFFNYPAIKDLAGYFNDWQSKDKSLGCLVALNKGNDDKPPLFLVHPIGGTIFCYQPLANQLNYPVYAFQDPSIDAGKNLFQSVEEMAKHYVEILRQTYPQTHYLIGGFSSGGAIAIEMAKQLGKQASHLILFDSWAFYPSTISEKKALEQGFKKIHASWINDPFFSKDLDWLLELQWQRKEMLENYLYQPIQANVILLKARELLPDFASMQSPYNYWDKHSIKPISCHAVSGNHLTLLEHAQALAVTCSQILESIIAVAL